MAERPKVLVMSCRGADQGAMSVVRTLGRRGIRVAVLSDSEDCITQYSRYCGEFIYRPDFTHDTAATLDWLLAFAAQQDTAPVLFPTADPDLALLSRLRNKIEGPYRLFLGSQELVDVLMDKTRFMDLAILHQFPVPATHAPETQREFFAVSESVRYPVVLKPSNPAAWTHREIQYAVQHQKALIVESAEQLRAYYGVIAPWNDDLLVQEYIVGPDENHYSAHVYINAEGEPQACFTGRKVRVHPAFAGSGCYVQSVHVPEMVEASLQMLRAIRYTGVAVLNFKQDSRNGKFLLHEINPRISQWNILATKSGVDVPWFAYAEAAGITVPAALTQREGLQYLDLRNDLKSWRQYRRVGQWGVLSYVKSLVRARSVHQLFAVDDLRPFANCLSGTVRGLIGKLFGKSTAEASEPFFCELEAANTASPSNEYVAPRPVREAIDTPENPGNSVDPIKRMES